MLIFPKFLQNFSQILLTFSTNFSQIFVILFSKYLKRIHRWHSVQCITYITKSTTREIVLCIRKVYSTHLKKIFQNLTQNYSTLSSIHILPKHSLKILKFSSKFSLIYIKFFHNLFIILDFLNLLNSFLKLD